MCNMSMNGKALAEIRAFLNFNTMKQQNHTQSDIAINAYNILNGKPKHTYLNQLDYEHETA